ncbi:serine/threonine-protein kinase Tao-like [Amphibalanus amphitrite]|uniref:serine/threonine-protein kinase Tao-like n=1 Tax=Amphibalanus amphitrite TaxID=1232801 RepID=UPI001C9068F6|nr:serine/threonine-protein kinase Tao-like [Amphibalanus amphitrite]XP_043227083.1 serine/threonine-protein kinase Tao-like [Amphibalanus amphitrite]
MSYTGKQSAEKWQEILKELRFLRQLNHKNTVEYKACYLKDHTAWFVMEYCLGSASDIIEVHKAPLKEDEIAAITEDVLNGLDYLHSMGKIHRDIKAGNILLTEYGHVKLADFGSASLKCPANSFVGTPYWMSPEVILAMDEGQYDGKVDIWSLGITCLELAERKPPYFNMNAMSALYHIAQNDSPTLASRGWSDVFRHFVTLCLMKDPCDRPTASRLLSHHFIVRPRSPNIILDLIARTKAAVRELDNLNYKKMKKILMVETETESTVGDIEVDSVGDNGDLLGDGSKSNSITSEQSAAISASSQSSSTSSIPPGEGGAQGFLTAGRKPKTEANSNNFATIRTTTLITRQQKEHMQEEMHEQMSGYKRMRREHQAALIKLEEKCRVEMENHKAVLDKEYESLITQFTKELERLQVKHNQEMEKKVKGDNAAERALQKEITTRHAAEHKLYLAQAKKENKQNIERWKRELSTDESTPKKQRDAMLQNHKESIRQHESSEDQRLKRTHKDYLDLEIRKFRRRKLVGQHHHEQDLLRDELNKRQQQLEQAHAMLLRHHDQTQELEYRQQKAVHAMREEHVKSMHTTELNNQHEYMRRAQRELRKKHALELKQQPKSLKQKEVQIRKQYRETCKIQTRQFKALKQQIQQTTPKEEQKSLLKRLKEDQKRKLALLGQQYEHSIAEMLQKQSIRLDESQEVEQQQLKDRLDRELEILMAYQSKNKLNAERQRNKERRELEERVSVRRQLLEQKMMEERQQFQQERAERIRLLQERHHLNLEQFDDESLRLGFSALQVEDGSGGGGSGDDGSSLAGGGGGSSGQLSVARGRPASGAAPPQYPPRHLHGHRPQSAL